MKKTLKNKIVIIIFLITIMSFIGIYAGHFLLKGKENILPQIGKAEPVRYQHLSKVINGFKQEIDILDIDISDKSVEVKPVLSYDSVFGFETLSVMAQREKAYAAVNAGFFHEYGQPAGMVVIRGKILMNSTGDFPVLQIIGNKAKISDLTTKLWLKAGDKRIPIDNLNIAGKQSGICLYTPEFGTDNRADRKNVSFTIENNAVTKVAVYKGSVKIPSNGMLLTLYNPQSLDIGKQPFKVGDKVELLSDPAVESGSQYYECGSWIVKGGKVVAPTRDKWIGLLTNHDPRTAVGIKDNGHLLLMTVDGRQPGYSIGFTGKELGEFLLTQGVKDAAMLDGGSSTEMIVQGKMVNRPSYDGRERLLGGGIVVRVSESN